MGSRNILAAMDLNLDALVAVSAVAAFFVAVFSLYASSLKRGDIELVMISNPAEIQGEAGRSICEARWRA